MTRPAAPGRTGCGNARPAPRLVLVCNSHIDPVWLWPWEEGLAATLATFRTAADLCDEFESFVFCHNEALLYAWVEEYDPPLFERIRKLVAGRRWQVMGGWYLQPDCNLPSGESLVRQVLVGKQYFLERFGVEPRVAVNLDPFGHARGLVQILAKSGYTGYLFCRPDADWLTLPADDFLWVGHDGSSIVAHRSLEHYNSNLGEARAKVERWLSAHAGQDSGLVLWGVGNHGGGASRADLRDLAALQSGRQDWSIVHGRPEDYFDGLSDTRRLPRFERDLNPWAAGCYSSMATVKQAHARLERALFAAEAASATAALQGLMPYPRTELRAALEDLLFCQFHDILPGEGVREVERQALERLGHGSDIVGRLRARVFFSLLSGQPRAEDGEYPIFVHNHHPFEVDALVECEFQPPEPNRDRDRFWQPDLRAPDGGRVPVQLEKESCNIRMDQRKRIVFHGHLAPSAVTRFSCRLVDGKHRGLPHTGEEGAAPPHTGERVEGSPHADLEFRSARAVVVIDGTTGLLSRYSVDGVEHLAAPAFRPLVVRDTADPWGMKVRAFRDVAGEFALLSPRAAAAFAGASVAELTAVRVIEAGPVRTVVEALLGFGRSALALRYKVPQEGAEIEIELAVSWFERDLMLKLAVPTAFSGGLVERQTAYGVDVAEAEAEELVCHRWIAMRSPDGRRALTLANDSTSGFDVTGGELRVSLLRAAAYAGHPVGDTTPIVPQDRYEPREDQGVHTFRFWLNAGEAGERMETIDREAAVRNDGLFALNAFPSGDGCPALPGLVVEDPAVRLGCTKMSEDGSRLVVRLFEPTGSRRTARVRVPPIGLDFQVPLGPFEIKTLAIDPATGSVVETDLLERALSSEAGR